MEVVITLIVMLAIVTVHVSYFNNQITLELIKRGLPEDE